MSEDRKKERYWGQDRPVVSVRLDRELLERLDRLSEHTGRSRGFYLRRAIEQCLLRFEGEFYSHSVISDDLAADFEFLDVINKLNDGDE